MFSLCCAFSNPLPSWCQNLSFVQAILLLLFLLRFSYIFYERVDYAWWE
uniref:Uncharacterized protein n=1 Tax=Rhizophora mucronata TaxID=61149 RepID=A0A2P2P252_RHIMU